MPHIRRIVIFGDSLSDIGRMKRRAVSRFAVINDHGRFSDGMNWVDFFWDTFAKPTLFVHKEAKETIARSERHFDLSACGAGSGLELANFAEGGALAIKDVSDISGLLDSIKGEKILSNLDDQIAEYEQCRASEVAVRTAPDSETLFILWAGANDIVTIHRDPLSMANVAKGMITHAFRLLRAAPGSHALLIDLPDPQFMPRFEADSDSELQRLSDAASIFNDALAMSIDSELEFDLVPTRNTISLFKISEELTGPTVSAAGFAPFAQPKGEKPGGTVGKERVEKAPLLKNVDVGFDQDSEFGTVRDQLHPTQGVYELINDKILEHLEASGFEMEGA